MLSGEKQPLLHMMHLSPKQTPKTGQVGHAEGVPMYITKSQTKLGKPEGITQAPTLPLQTRRGGHLWKPCRASLQAVKICSPSLGTLEYMPHIKHFQAAWNVHFILSRNLQKQKVNKTPGMEIRIFNFQMNAPALGISLATSCLLLFWPQIFYSGLWTFSFSTAGWDPCPTIPVTLTV